MKTFVESQFEVRRVYEFQTKRILMKTFVVSQFEAMQVYEFQAKANSYEDIC